MLTLLLIFSMCACSSATPATIIDNEGNTIEMTAEELIEIAEGNNAQYEKYYLGAAIEVTGEVSQIETGVGPYDNDCVYLEEGWVIRTEDGWYDWADVAIGTKLKVKSNISYYGDGFIGPYSIMIEGCAVDAAGVWYSNNELREQTVIEIIE